MIDARTLKHRLDIVFIKADCLDTISHGQMLESYKAAIDDAFANSVKWVPAYDRSKSKGRRWYVVNRFTDEKHLSSRTKRIIRYEFESAAVSVAKRLNDEGA